MSRRMVEPLRDDRTEQASTFHRWWAKRRRMETFADLGGVLPVVVGALGYVESGKGFPYWTV